MTVAGVLTQAARQLGKAGLPQARQEAEYLLSAVLDIPRLRLLLDAQRRLTSAQWRKTRVALRRRAQRWPLAYIVGDQPFRDLTLRVTPAVLIPRPETESWVEGLLERIQAAARPVKVADIGTGSGCIALSMAGSPWVRNIWAVDRSAAALNVARRNGRSIPAARKCRWLHGNLAQPLLARRIRVDYVLANLPYVATADMRRLEPELRREPAGALHGGKDGLDLIRTLAAQAPKVLVPGGRLMLEIGIRQAKPVKQILKSAGVWDDIAFYKDLSGIMRVAEARLKT